MLFVLILFALPSHAAVSLATLDFGRCSEARKMVVASDGVVFVVAYTNICGIQGRKVALAKIRPDGELIWRKDLGGSQDQEPLDVVLQHDGSVLVVGRTNSADFPLVNPLLREPPQNAGFLLKIDSSTGEILQSTYLWSPPSAVTTDRRGRIYLGGSTRSPEFPTTKGAFQTTGPRQVSIGAITYAFLMKLTPDANNILFSTFLGSDGNTCSGSPSGCIGITGLGYSGVLGLHVDDHEQVLVVGATSSPLFPTTPNAFMKTCSCRNWSTAGFLTKFNSTGTALLWSTYFGSPTFGFDRFTSSGTAISDFQVSRDGGIVIAGRVGSVPFPTTPGALQETYHGPKEIFDLTASSRSYDGFISKLSPDGSGLVYSTIFGGGNDDSIASFVLTEEESPVFSGISRSDDLPSLDNSLTLGSSLVGSISPDARKLLAQHRLPAGIGDRQIRWAPDGRLVLLGSRGTLIWASLDDLPSASLFTIQDPADLQLLPLPRVAPGEMLQLTGANLGPGTAFAPEPEDRYPMEWNGYQVLFDGIPGPILYLDRHTLRTVAPFTLSGRQDVQITLRTPGGEAVLRTRVVPVQPFLFRREDGTVFALNEDGTIHSEANPAVAGSSITLFGSGFGLLNPRPEDGSIVHDDTPRTMLPVVSVQSAGNIPLIATAAPGQVAGMVRIVATVPSVTAINILILTGQDLSWQSGGRIWVRF